MVTGDHAQIAEPVGLALGLDRVYADCSPQDKLEVVRSVHSRADLRPVMMVGDGVNDAPALALSDVGVAMAGRARRRPRRPPTRSSRRTPSVLWRPRSRSVGVRWASRARASWREWA
jgi:magnesium-transporting ATPase (P-type)